LKIKILGTLAYLVSTFFFYEIGNVFNISWLMLHNISYYPNGSLSQVSGSIMPFLLSLPIYLLTVKKLKTRGI